MIRRAEPSDAPAIGALVQEAYAHYPERIGVRPGPMDADHLREIAEKEVWLTPPDGRLLGVIVLRREPDHLFVDNVAVAPAAQGTGVGRALLDHAARRALALGLDELRLLTHELMTENRAFYAHLGWQPIDPPAGERLPRLYFRKLLHGGG